MSQSANLLEEITGDGSLVPPRLPSIDAPPASSRRVRTPESRARAVQYDASRMGALLLVAVDGMFFASLLGAVALVFVSRPEVFAYGRYFLDSRLGLAETSVLVASGLAGTLAVRFVALHRWRSLARALGAAVALAAVFLGLQAAEYEDHVARGLLPGVRFLPTEEVWETPAFRREHPAAAHYAARFRFVSEEGSAAEDSRTVRRHPVAARTRPTRAEIEPLVVAGALGENAVYPKVPSEPHNAHVFFGLYFLATAVQSLHVLGALFVFAWLFHRARRARCSDLYESVDRAALYLDLVVLMRIFLVPLFYLVR